MQNINFKSGFMIYTQETPHRSCTSERNQQKRSVLHKQVVVTKCSPCNQIPLSLALLKLYVSTCISK